MNFAIISPTAGLYRYSGRSKTQMVLAHQYVKDEDYARFYRLRKAQGDFIFLDNGAYEGACDEATLLKAVSQLQPDVAVLPDVICSAASTYSSFRFFKKHRNDFPDVRWMFIPQGRTLSHWKASFNCLKHFEELDNVWLGLTRFLPTHVCPDDFLIRVKLASELKQTRPDLQVHCMGMADGDINELRLLAAQRYVRSVDSSAPVWRGWQGINIQAREDWRKNGTEVDFAASLQNESMIEENLEVVLGHCKL